MASLADQLWEDAGTPLCEEFYGVSVTLERDGESSDEFTAIADSVRYSVESPEGFFTAIEARDYTMPVGITLDVATIVPQVGDRIHETINGAEEVFEVLPIGTDSAVSPTPTGTQWLVHTKRVQ